MKNPEFHINAYRHVYWLYAVLNKQYGKDLKFRRDPLHGRYAVNRHSFSVQSHNNSLFDIFKFLSSVLQESGYKIESKSHQDITLKKTTIRSTATEKLYVSIRISHNQHDEPVLSIFTNSYWD